ncbi:MAG: dienelactone hydrolase family protein [Proteobacteria bacterium]|nr:dienelactone hydrolase family protein [Pseudomonadota bacterium]
MGINIELTAADRMALGAYETLPGGEPLGGVVVIQEIFGVTAHIRDVVDAFAAAGYHALAPALFDRLEPGVMLPYTDVEGGRELVSRLTREDIVADVGAAVMHLAGSGRVGVVGYCWGGTVAWIAAATLPVSAAVSYYGTRINQNLDLKPRCPMQFHYGRLDASVPPERIDEVRAACPGGEFHLYPAGHGFNCTDRADYHADSARLAFERTLSFLGRHLGQD